MTKVPSLTVPQIVPIASKDKNLYEALQQMISHANQLTVKNAALEDRVTALEAKAGS